MKKVVVCICVMALIQTVITAAVQKRSDDLGDELIDEDKRTMAIDDAIALIETNKPKVELFIICDQRCAYAFKYDAIKAKEFITDIVARMNQVMSTRNMSVSLVGSEIWSTTQYVNFDPSVIGTSEGDVLVRVISQIAFYRDAVINNKVNSDFFLLLHGEKIDGVNGGANTGAICKTSDESLATGFISYDPYIPKIVNTVAQTALHEMGHALGFSHDKSDCVCELGADECIMGASQTLIQIANPVYSECSLGRLAYLIQEEWLDCVMADSQIIEVACGNGRIDDGEDCDCGGSECDCCDVLTCTFMDAGMSCANNECGTCTGTSKTCDGPLAPTFSGCDESRGYCYDGTCSSLNRKCQEHFGPAVMADYDMMKENVNQQTAEYNTGGYKLYDPNVGAWSQYMFFTKDSTSTDGTCGTVKCVTTDTARHLPGTYMTGQTFRLDDKPATRLAYYRASDAYWGSYRYIMYYPVLATTGTPCTLLSGAQGYCKVADDLVKDGWGWNAYPVSQCLPITN